MQSKFEVPLSHYHTAFIYEEIKGFLFPAMRAASNFPTISLKFFIQSRLPFRAGAEMCWFYTETLVEIGSAFNTIIKLIMNLFSEVCFFLSQGNHSSSY